VEGELFHADAPPGGGGGHKHRHD